MSCWTNSRCSFDLERPVPPEDLSMIRLVLTLAALLALASGGSASLTPRKAAFSSFGNEGLQQRASQLSALVLEQGAGRGTKLEFLMTDGTEVLLNGKPCKYEKVPAHASIVRMEVAEDKKTVLKIHFRTGK